MAGDTKETSASELSTPDAPKLTDPFPGIAATLDGIREALVGLPTGGPSRFDLAASLTALISGHDWQRLHVSMLVVSASAAGTAVLTIGSVARTFNVDLGVTPIPFPETIDRGADVSLTGTAANISGYLIATPE